MSDTSFTSGRTPIALLNLCGDFAKGVKKMLTKDDVLKVSRLARLSITDQEAEDYGAQFEKILEYFKALASVSTDNIEPLVTPTPIELFMREDIVNQTHSVEDILSNAPDLRGHLFKVPPVV